MQLELLILSSPIGKLSLNPNNSRTHSKKQIRQIAKSIREFGFINPILVDRNGVIIAGHGRYLAALLLGLTEVPNICLEHLSKDQIRAYIIADNRLAELAGWDKEILAVELHHLLTIEDLDLTVTGFEVPEIDLVLEEGLQASEPEDEPHLEVEGPVVSCLGDLWLLGKHRLLCGDALKPDSFAKLMLRHRAQAVITDPPYNVRIFGHATGNGKVRHREFAMASGELSEVEYVSFLTTVLKLLAHHSADGALQFIFNDWRHLKELSAVGEQVYDSLLNLCVWVKHAGGMGSLYRSQHELIFVYRNGKASHRNNVQLGKFGRNRTNVWNYPGSNSFSKRGEEGDLVRIHPTVKPVALVADAILDCSARGELILDPFLGSGTTLMAAERVGRTCCGMEIDPLYVDVAIRRWQQCTGESAVHAASGKQFHEVATEREAELV